MKILPDEIIFDNLTHPSRSMVGERSQIKAKVPSFVSSNAKGDLRNVTSLTEVESLGKMAATHLESLFA